MSELTSEKKKSKLHFYLRFNQLREQSSPTRDPLHSFSHLNCFKATHRGHDCMEKKLKSYRTPNSRAGRKRVQRGAERNQKVIKSEGKMYKSNKRSRLLSKELMMKKKTFSLKER